MHHYIFLTIVCNWILSPSRKPLTGLSLSKLQTLKEFYILMPKCPRWGRGLLRNSYVNKMQTFEETINSTDSCKYPIRHFICFFCPKMTISKAYFCTQHWKCNISFLFEVTKGWSSLECMFCSLHIWEVNRIPIPPTAWPSVLASGSIRGYSV